MKDSACPDDTPENTTPENATAKKPASENKTAENATPKSDTLTPDMPANSTFRDNPRVAAEATYDTQVISRRVKRKDSPNLSVLPAAPKTVAGRILCIHWELATMVGGILMVVSILAPRDLITVAATGGVILLGAGWGQLLRLPMRARPSGLMIVAGVSAIILMRFVPDLALIVPILGVGVAVAFVLEMTRKQRTNLLESVSGSITGLVIAVSGGFWSVLGAHSLWRFMLVPAGIALLGATLGVSLSAPWTLRWRVVATLIGGVLLGVGAGVGIVLLDLPANAEVALIFGEHLSTLGAAVAIAGLIGLSIGVMSSLLITIFAEELAPSTVLSALSLGVIPLLVVSVPVYALTRVLEV